MNGSSLPIPESNMSVELETRTLERPLRAYLPHLREPSYYLSEVAVHPSLLKRLFVIDGSWVEIHNLISERKCLARVYSVNACPKDLIFVTPSIEFDLNLDERNNAVTIDNFKSSTPSEYEHLVPVAEFVSLSRVRTPFSESYADYTVAIGNFFRQPHIISKGQVIGVPLTGPAWLVNDKGDYLLAGHSDSAQEVTMPEWDATGKHSRPAERFPKAALAPPGSVRIVFFEVAEVRPAELEYFRVKPDESYLVQRGACSSRVPYKLDLFFAKQWSGDLIWPSVHDTHTTDRIPWDMCSEIHTGKSRDPYQRMLFLIRPCLHHASSALGITSSVLLCGPRRCGKRVLVAKVSRALGIHLVEVNAYKLLGSSENEASSNLADALDSAIRVAPCILHVRRLVAFCQQSKTQQREPIVVSAALKSMIERLRHPRTDPPVFIIGSSDSLSDLPGCIRSCFTHESELSPPDTKEREIVLRHSLTKVPVDKYKLITGEDSDISPRALAPRLAGLSNGALRSLVADAGRRAVRRLVTPTPAPPAPRTFSDRSSMSVGDDDFMSEFYGNGDEVETAEEKTDTDDLFMSPSITPSELAAALAAATEQHRRAGAASAHIPSVRWADVGGLEAVRREVLDMVELPLRYPELFADGVKQRSGLLLYGPPGTGKTLVAKAVATECSLNFLSVKGPELLNMYVGESEENIRTVFERARHAKPSVLFFDELDSLAPRRGQGVESGGVMDRVVSQLLTELDGMNKTTDVFVIGATNRPDLLDPALLRPGRLDKCLYLGVSDTEETQTKILSALTRKFTLDKSVKLSEIVKDVPMNFTGADLYALCSDALLLAMKRKVSEIDEIVTQRNAQVSIKHVQTPRSVLTEMSASELIVNVMKEDFVASLGKVSASLSHKELQKYAELKNKFSSFDVSS
eukprot:911178_1